MSKFFKLVCFLLVSVSIQAQDAAKAKSLLDEVSAKVKTYENIVIDFFNIAVGL